MHSSLSLRRVSRAAAVLIATTALLVGGCATTQNVNKIDKLDSLAENPRILLMKPDVKLSLLTASGMAEPQAEWTDTARRNFADAAEAYGKQRQVDVVRMSDDAVLSEEELAYQRLYEAVGATILTNYYGVSKLPSKADGFDWSMGSGVSVIRDKYNADYALFSFYRDTNSSGGRVAMMVLFAAAGVALPGGGQGGYASLVDLKTGDIVWFNMVNAGAGDLRTPEGASTAVKQLFSNLPQK